MWHAGNGRPGLLIDTGAARPLTGSISAKSQVVALEAQGFKVVWQTLLMPEHMRGIGRGSMACSEVGHLARALHDRGSFNFQRASLG